MPSNNQLPLSTERVASSRRGPLAVVLVALALVAVLAWKPWDGPAPALPSPTWIAARPTPSPAPTASPAPTVPAATPIPSPAIPAVDVAWTSPFVQCSYQLRPHQGSLLTNITLFPPTVVLHPNGIGEPVSQVMWRALVQSNLEQTLFTAPWDPVSASRWRPAPDRADTSATLKAINIDYAKGPFGPTIVVRIEISVEWLGPDGRPRGSASVVPTSYQHGEAGAILPEGCHTII